jgi:DNA-binding PadR family transcriptional regulator
MPNRSRATNDVIALTVLALTSERPRHPYDIQRAIRDRHKDFAAGKTRALYRAVERLEQDGLIAPLETSREGKRPERTVYHITQDGREELDCWLAELLELVRPEFPLYSVALSFVAYVPADVVIDQLQARMVALRAAVAGAEAALKTLLEDMRLPRAVLLDSELTLAMRKAELEWTRGLIEQLRTKRLWWTPEALWQEFDKNGSRPRNDRNN